MLNLKTISKAQLIKKYFVNLYCYFHFNICGIVVVSRQERAIKLFVFFKFVMRTSKFSKKSKKKCIDLDSFCKNTKMIST